METVKLKLDWANHKATVFACKNWHYSKSVPNSKLVKIGVWEDNLFKGVVIFSCGANNNIASPYGLKQFEVCELTRVALNKHVTPVTKIISIAIKMLKKLCPKLKLIISYADLDQGHEGTIYKAGNWIYTGCKLRNSTDGSFIVKGKRLHGKTFYERYMRNGKFPNMGNRLQFLQKNVDSKAVQYITKGKHKYVYVLDEVLRESIMKMKVDFA